ncbi:adult-specific rigid cuticular protein 15.5-like [Argiope bruennichi]|uniref:adult-specific rigid cuticular protein 15.5-like n=1 Tax=Argiope bruennichi TaxID=94029 RepID=UPI002495722D|nr:adult-specific rigid cuticular protein 15.5-like [Argiope bruennichi]
MVYIQVRDIIVSSMKLTVPLSITMIQLFILTLSVVLSQVAAIYNYPYYISTGTSQQYKSQDGIGNYQFGYDEAHSSGGTFRKETGDAWGNKYGSYGLRDADGRYRVVNYVADGAGFRANINSNEPGVAPDDPASTVINKPGVPVPVVQAPIVQSPVVSKPVLYAPSLHHAASPQFPLLYQTYSPAGYYKGTPFTSKGTTYITNKGSPYYGYYIYP